MSKPILSIEDAKAIAAAIMSSSTRNNQDYSVAAYDSLVEPELPMEAMSTVKKRGRPAKKKTADDFNGDSYGLEDYPMDLVDSWMEKGSKESWSDDL